MSSGPNSFNYLNTDLIEAFGTKEFKRILKKMVRES